MTLVYIAGYITKKDNETSEFDTYFYEKYGDYRKSLERGKLKIPSDHTCQWLFFCFILFHTLKENVCHISLSNILILIPDFHFFRMERKHVHIFANIVLKNFCRYNTPRSDKEPALK